MLSCIKDKNKEAMANARTRTVLIESAIAAFHSEVKLGPEFVCTCCHRMMYRKSVVACNKGKYTKTSTDVLHKVFSPDYSYISFGGKEWICKTCETLCYILVPHFCKLILIYSLLLFRMWLCHNFLYHCFQNRCCVY